MTFAANQIGNRWADGDNWQAVPGCPCRLCEDAAAAARPRTTLRLSDGVEVVLEMRGENDPAPPRTEAARAAAARDGALDALKRMGWL